MSSTNLPKIVVFALTLAIVCSSAIPQRHPLTILKQLVRQDGPEKDNKDPEDMSPDKGETKDSYEEEKKDESVTPCFPGTALVTLDCGEQKQMSELSIGDRVAVGGGLYSEVYMFTHQLSGMRYEFIELNAGSKVLRTTKGHYLYVSGRYLPAGDVKVGDELELSDGSSTAVTSVKTVMDNGLYNPQTVHGDIIVNGLRAATFTPTIQRNLAAAMLSPLHTMFGHLGFTCAMFSSNADLGPSGK